MIYAPTHQWLIAELPPLLMTRFCRGALHNSLIANLFVMCLGGVMLHIDSLVSALLRIAFVVPLRGEGLSLEAFSALCFFIAL